MTDRVEELEARILANSSETLGLVLSMQDSEMSFGDWVRIGIANKWCSDIVCATHDGIPTTPEEDAEWDDGSDPCQPVVRIWGD